MDQLIQAMKAAGEPTRMRLLLVLNRSELTVSELCRILGQSQPRVSRHLKLLCDAGLLVRQAEGTSAYYRHARSPFADRFLADLLDLTEGDHEAVARDRQELASVRAARAELAARSFEKVAQEADLLAEHRVPVADVEAAMLAAVGDLEINRLLDVGTGTGRVLELFAPRIQAGMGLELSREMLNLARTQLDAADLNHCSVRYGNAYNLDVPVGSVSLAVLHHVLHFLDEPGRAIAQAARAVEASGRLIIVDFGPHHIEELRTDHGHRRLGFSEEEVHQWCLAADLLEVDCTHLELPTDPPGLTISMWVATQRPDAPKVPNLEVA
ncbi:MAG: metalloregulator ArsR/SmtB family transcription factor [Actinomycetota bacterium]